jgi:nitrate/nitrite transport system ATP-binding protein
MVTNDVDEAVLMADRIIALTPAPKATLGESFEVRLARPRDRTTLNFNKDFKKLRNEVTRYLLDINQESRQLRVARNSELPDLSPMDFTAA